MSNDNVIIPVYSQNRSVYHTDVCRQVHVIDNKRYITEAQAETMELTECAYCSGEYRHENTGTRKLEKQLRNMDPEEVFGDD
jgi:hypothetical protein